MTADVIAGLVALVLSLAFGGFAWWRTQRHGAEIEKRKQARREAKAWEKAVRRHRRPLPDDRQFLARLRRMLDDDA